MLKTRALRRFVSVLVTSVLLLAAHEGSARDTACVVEVAPPPPGFADAAALRSTAEAEVRKLGALGRAQRRVVISLSLTQKAASPVACSVNATVRDARTGAMLAIIETAARAEGGPNTAEQRREVAYAAIRSAVRRAEPTLRKR